MFRTHAIEFGRATRESSGACVHTKDASHRRGLFSVGDCICYDLSFAEFMRLLCKKYVWAMVLEIWASVQNVASVLARCESSRENVVAFEVLFAFPAAYRYTWQRLRMDTGVVGGA